MFKEINSIDELPIEGLYVLVIRNSNKAPCRKFVNTVMEVSSWLVDIPFYLIDYRVELKETIRITYMPALYVYRDGKELNMISGHFWGSFQIRGEIERFL